MKVHSLLKERVGKSIFMLSISVEPHIDSADKLRKYAALYGEPKKGWLYLTGNYDGIDLLRHRLGVYDPDPIIDKDKTQHSGIITFGNDKTNRWAALPALMNSEELVRTILRITRGEKDKR